MPTNFDVTVSPPSKYSSDKFSKTNADLPLKKSEHKVEIAPLEIPDNINKVRKKTIRGVIKHDGPSDK
ncbi:MAG: hypothetical protein SFU55_07565 [Methylophilus sp.]|nr:hypothetical protein [Methylophilus sp.]